MSDAARETWITGIGIVSCLGEGPEAHWLGLSAPPHADTSRFAPYPVHALAPVDFDKQIPKKGDQRQMEAWQRIGTYAAGLALDSAGVKGDTELLRRMDMIVAASGGERDQAADAAIMGDLPKAANPAALLNERLMSDLRPTLFLAQLSNLLAGNISIVHGVVGSSRTFMGEEEAGVDAVRVALARIAAGQSDIALVGGANNGERKDLLLLFEAGGYCWKGDLGPVWARASGGGGFVIASLGAFLVLEARPHAEARGARPLARLTSVTSDRTRRAPGDVTASLGRLFGAIAPRLAPGYAVISGASGAEPATSEEQVFLAGLPGVPVRASGTHIGHGFEPQFAMNIALATLALRHGGLYPPADAAGIERAAAGPLTQVVVTGVGHWRGEGLALVEAAG